MEKTLYLKTACQIRKWRQDRPGSNSAHHFMEKEYVIGTRFSELAGELDEQQRRTLLLALKSSLEKERRRSLARKCSYDAGRHISLYIAVKTLSDMKKPPA